MRKAGDFNNETHANRFVDFLLTQGIPTKVDEDSGTWQVWVLEEKDLDNARFEYEEFIEAPDDPLYMAAVREAEQLRRREKRKARDRSKNHIDLGKQWRSRPTGLYPMTLTLIGLCVVATFYSGGLFPTDDPAAQQVLTELALPQPVAGDQGLFYLPKAVLQGQVWRLVTPIFPHGGFITRNGLLHLLFNMSFLLIIGQIIEIRRGLWIYLALVVGLAVISNLAAYWWSLAMGREHIAIGMSGVLYGLFGYAWIKSQFDRAMGIYISPNMALILIAWLFICMTGLVGNIANSAHVSGLLAGAAISYAPIAWSDFQRGRRGREE
ncbi:MAG: rhomboid family intramembrane serine protease [Pirellulales bacterium]